MPLRTSTLPNRRLAVPSAASNQSWVYRSLSAAGRRIRLNRFGHLFLLRVNRALGELDDARLELADAVSEDRGSVAVAAETLRALTDVVARFRADRPEVQLRLYQSRASVMVEQLRSAEIDFALASQPLVGVDLEAIELFSEEVLLAVPPGHHLAAGRRRRVAVAELLDEPFVVTRAGQWQRTLLEQLFADTGQSPVVACEGDEPSAVRGLISAGVGVGLLPTISRLTTTSPEVAWLHLDTGTARRTLRLYWRTTGYLSGAARRFRDFTLATLGNELIGD